MKRQVPLMSLRENMVGMRAVEMMRMFEGIQRVHGRDTWLEYFFSPRTVIRGRDKGGLMLWSSQGLAAVGERGDIDV